MFDSDLLSHNMMRMIPVSSDFLQPEDEYPTVNGSEQELVSVTGTYPCVFKVGQSFYDFTPFKIGA